MKSSLWKIPKIKNDIRRLATEAIISDLTGITIDKNILIKNGYLKDSYWNILIKNWLKPVANFNWYESNQIDPKYLNISKYYKKYSYEVDWFWKLEFLFAFNEELWCSLQLPDWYQTMYTRSNSGTIKSITDLNWNIVPDSIVNTLYEKYWSFYPEITLIPTTEQKKKITKWWFKNWLSCEFSANIDDKLWSTISKWLNSFETKIKKCVQRDMLATNFWNRETLQKINKSEIESNLLQKLDLTYNKDYLNKKPIKTNELKKDNIYSFLTNSWEMIFIPYWIGIDSQSLNEMKDTTIETMANENNIYGYWYLADIYWFWNSSLWAFLNILASSSWISQQQINSLQTKEPDYFRIPLFSDGKSLYFKETRTNNKIVLEKRI